MLNEFEAATREQFNTKLDNLQQLQLFTRAEGDVYCIGHIINLVVQEALKTLKAIPIEKIKTYQMIYQSIAFPIEFRQEDVISALYKLQYHIYIFLEMVCLENCT